MLRSTFMFNEWLTVDEDTGMTEVFRRVSKQEDVLGLSHMIKESTWRTATDSHLWLSIMVRPTQSSFTRAQRLSCAVTALFLTMITSAMFYGVDVEQPKLLSIGPVKISVYELWVSCISLIIVVPPSVTMVQIFRNVRPSGHAKSNITKDTNDNITEDTSTSDEMELNSPNNLNLISNDQSQDSGVYADGFTSDQASCTTHQEDKETDLHIPNDENYISNSPAYSDGWSPLTGRDIHVGTTSTYNTIGSSDDVNASTVIFDDSSNDVNISPTISDDSANGVKVSSTIIDDSHADMNLLGNTNDDSSNIGDRSDCENGSQTITHNNSDGMKVSKSTIDDGYDDMNVSNTIGDDSSHDAEVLSTIIGDSSEHGNLSQTIDDSLDDMHTSTTIIDDNSGDAKASTTCCICIKKNVAKDKKKKREKRYLPRCCLVVGWIVCFLGIITPAFFLILYSMDWGKEKSNAWLVSFVLSFVESVTVADPVKVRYIIYNMYILLYHNLYTE